MKLHPAHRSSAIRVLIGGALAVTLGTVSSAWACTAQAQFDVREIPGPLVVADGDRDVELVFTHIEPPEDGTIVIAKGQAPVEPTVVIATRPMTKGVAVTFATTVPVAGAGYHYFSAWTTDTAGDVTPSSMRTGLAQVKRPPASAPNETAPTNTDFGLNPVNPKGADAKPVAPGDAKPVAGVNRNPLVPAVNPAVPNQVAPAAGPSTATRSDPLPGAATAPQNLAEARPLPVLPATAVARAGQDPLRPAPVQAGARVDQPTRSPTFLAPEPSDLWSGIDPARAASLLDAPAPAANGAGITVGAGLLGLGTLALAGVAALAARRRLAVAGPSRRG